MSFSTGVKEEIVHMTDAKPCCQKSELAALLRNGLCFRTSGKKTRLLFISENAALSRHVFRSIRDLYGSRPGVVMQHTHKLKDHAVYQLDFTGLTDGSGLNFMEEIGIIIKKNKLHYSPYHPRKRCCQRAFLRGCFLASGSISDPDKGYHLEISFLENLLLKEFQTVLKEFHFQAKEINRKGRTLAYMKEGQEIVDFLNIIGAHSALMQMENIRILKDVRNQVNRIVNCETANLEKMVNASVRQVEQIQFLVNHIGLDSLPDGLKTIAELRLNHPQASLQELGEMLSPPLTKSGVNHRLRKLEVLVEKARVGEMDK